jgi:GT2 family glycosyltransferase
VVDDASDDATPGAIQSVIEHFAHEQTFFYENPTELGRERSIKELLQLVESPLLWMPEEVDELLSDLRWVTTLLNSDVEYPFELDDVIQKEVQPQTLDKIVNAEEIAARWINSIDLDGVEDIEEEVAGSGEQATKDEQSTQLAEHSEEEGAESGEQGAEEDVDLDLALEDIDFNEDDAADFDGVVGEVRPMGSTKRKKLEKLGIDPEKAEKASRPPQKSSKDILKFRSSLRKNAVEMSDDASEVAKKVFPEVQQLVQEGENLHALKAIEKAQLNHPNDVDLLKLKVKILEFMRRYVEAAEIKHQLRMGGPGVAKPKVRKEAILIVDPTEDPGEAIEEHSTQFTEHSEGLGAESGEQGAEEEDSTQFAENSEDGGAENGEQGAEEHSTQFAEHSEEEGAESGEQGAEEHSTQFAEHSEEQGAESGEQGAEEHSTQFAEHSEEEGAESGEQGAEEHSTQFAEHSEEQGAVEEEEDEVQSSGVQGAGEQQIASMQPTEASVERPNEYDSKPRISIVIPTTIDGKALLERTLFSLSTKADKSDRELIIIDNASLDDTYEYLNQLKNDNFMQIRIITNPVNYGFARAVNQGVEAARGEYVLVMHNDVVLHNDAPGLLANIMDSYKDITTLGPLTEVTLNEEQRRKSVDPDPNVIKKTRYIDSFCMILRKSKARKFDERFGLAFFEDLDYCLEDAKHGGVVAIAPGVKVDHLGGATTNVIGRESYSQSYWKNASEFEKKWDALPSPAEFTETDSNIERLCMISELLNPFYPEPHLLRMAEEMMTSELRNEILERNYESNYQVALIRLMLALDMRDVARVLEDNLDPKELDESLLHLLTEFYYQKHIYSRSLKYLQMNPGKRRPFAFKLLELKVYMGTRDYDKASEILGELIHEMPTHPELFKISSDIHKARGSYSEAEEFYSLAHQTDPFTFK